MSPNEAVDRLNYVLAHLWMIRTFLKHADEVVEDEQLIEVPRLLYDTIRAVEPAFQKGDHATYLRRLRGKLSKLRRCAEMFQHEFRRVSAHTNFEMAAASLTGSVRQMEDIFATLQLATANPSVVDEVDSDERESP
jgi:hypothetical protein